MSKYDKLSPQQIEYSRRQLDLQLRKVFGIFSRRDLDPTLKPFLATFSQQGFVNIIPDADFARVVAGSDEIDKYSAEFARIKAAVHVRDPITGKSEGVWIKESYGLHYPWPKPYTVLTIAEELGHLATTHIETLKTEDFVDDHKGRSDLRYLQRVIEIERISGRSLGSDALWILNGYSTVVRHGDMTSEITRHRLYEELRAQIIASYVAGHVYANDSRSRKFSDGHPAVMKYADEDLDHKAMMTGRIGNTLGWENVIPLCVSGNLGDFLEAIDIHPKKSLLEGWIKHFMYVEEPQSGF